MIFHCHAWLPEGEGKEGYIPCLRSPFCSKSTFFLGQRMFNRLFFLLNKVSHFQQYIALNRSIHIYTVFLWWSNLQFHHPEGCLILFNPCILWHTTTVCHHAPWNQQLPNFTAPGTTNAAPSAIAGTFHRRSSQRCSLGDHQGHGYGWVRVGKFISWKSPKLPWKKRDFPGNNIAIS